MPKETSKPEQDDALIETTLDADKTAPKDDELSESVADAAEDAAAADTDEAEASDEADESAHSAAGATKRKKSKKKPLTKEEERAAAQEKKRAERERIERSKKIAAEARGKSYEPKTKGKKDGSSKPLTKEQERAAARDAAANRDGNPVWFKPIMFGFLILGFIWVLVYYLSSGLAPVRSLGDWNILVGFGISLVGFLMMSNWK